MVYTHHYASPLGGITLESDGGCLTGLRFDGQKDYTAASDARSAEICLPVFDRSDRWLDLYFSGQEPDFTPPLRLKTTAFRKAVWEILLSVPYGQTITYGEIARRIEEKTGAARMSARAVGGAVGHNPIALIIPCHRVVGSDGSLTGYAWGIQRKMKLLQLEQADMSRLFLRQKDTARR